jgi:hypothetical protein
MYRIVAAFFLLLVSVAASLAQGLQPAVWQGQRGSLLKVLTVDPTTGNFAGVFLSNPVGPCPAVPYDVVGRIVPDIEELDVGLQSNDGRVWTLRQPDDRCYEMDRDICRPGWSRGKGARHGRL